jgi:hypothetical protein
LTESSAASQIYIYILLLPPDTFPYKPLGLYVLITNLNGSNVLCKFICWQTFIQKILFKSYFRCKDKPTALIPAVAEPVELFRLKCAIDRRTNCSQLNALQTEQSFGLSGLRPIQPRFSRIEAGLPRTKASSHHRIAHQLLIYNHTYIITIRVQR